MTSYRTLLLGGAILLSAVAPAAADTGKAIIWAKQPQATAPATLSPAQKLQAAALLLQTAGPLVI